jgi:hypothetical protein
VVPGIKFLELQGDIRYQECLEFVVVGLVRG